jgi:hypothetical protein
MGEGVGISVVPHIWERKVSGKGGPI